MVILYDLSRLYFHLFSLSSIQDPRCHYRWGGGGAEFLSRYKLFEPLVCIAKKFPVRILAFLRRMDRQIREARESGGEDGLSPPTASGRYPTTVNLSMDSRSIRSGGFEYVGHVFERFLQGPHRDVRTRKRDDGDDVGCSGRSGRTLDVPLVLTPRDEMCPARHAEGTENNGFDSLA